MRGALSFALLSCVASWHRASTPRGREPPPAAPPRWQPSAAAEAKALEQKNTLSLPAGLSLQAVPLLVALVRGGNEGARQAAARALSNLACSDPASQARVLLYFRNNHIFSSSVF